MKPALFILLLSLGSFSLAQDLKGSNHVESLPRPKGETQEARPVADGEDYKAEYLSSNDLRTLGVGSALVLTKDRPIEIPANTKWATFGVDVDDDLPTKVKNGISQTRYTTRCYLVMREEDSRTREVKPGSKIIIGGGTPVKTKEGTKFAIEVPVESPASIKSIKCLGEKKVSFYPNSEAFDSLQPTDEIRSPINPLIMNLRTSFEYFGELVRALPVPVE